MKRKRDWWAVTGHWLSEWPVLYIVANGAGLVCILLAGIETWWGNFLVGAFLFCVLLGATWARFCADAEAAKELLMQQKAKHEEQFNGY